MAVKIRLRRMGRSNAAAYRIVAADERSPRDGRFIETLGWYDPKIEGANFKLDLERAEHWKKNGAQFSDTVRSLIRKAGRQGEPVAEEAPQA